MNKQTDTQPNDPQLQVLQEKELAASYKEVVADQIATTAKKPEKAAKILHSMENQSKTKTSSGPSSMPIIGALIIVLLGSASGFGLSKMFGGSAQATETVSTDAIQEHLEKGDLKVGEVFGSTDKEQFPDTAEGVLVAGGADGEGSHHLLRPGGASQNVYLTSSIIDLDLLVNHKVSVWGDTFAAQKAGWLMDVAGLEIKELNAEKPFDENPGT